MESDLRTKSTEVEQLARKLQKEVLQLQKQVGDLEASDQKAKSDIVGQVNQVKAEIVHDCKQELEVSILTANKMCENLEKLVNGNKVTVTQLHTQLRKDVEDDMARQRKWITEVEEMMADKLGQKDFLGLELQLNCLLDKIQSCENVSRQQRNVFNEKLKEAATKQIEFDTQVNQMLRLKAKIQTLLDRDDDRKKLREANDRLKEKVDQIWTRIEMNE